MLDSLIMQNVPHRTQVSQPASSKTLRALASSTGLHPGRPALLGLEQRLERATNLRGPKNEKVKRKHSQAEPKTRIVAIILLLINAVVIGYIFYAIYRGWITL